MIKFHITHNYTQLLTIKSYINSYIHHWEGVFSIPFKDVMTLIKDHYSIEENCCCSYCANNQSSFFSQLFFLDLSSLMSQPLFILSRCIYICLSLSLSMCMCVSFIVLTLIIKLDNQYFANKLPKTDRKKEKTQINNSIHFQIYIEFLSI